MMPPNGNGVLHLRPRRSMPDVVVAVSLPESVTGSLREVLPGTSRLMVALDFRDAERMLPSLKTACLVLMVPGTGDLAFTNAFGRIRKLFPHVEVLLLFMIDQSDPGRVLDFGMIGVSELVTINRRTDGEALRRGLSRCHSETVARQLFISANLSLPESLVTLFKAALRKAHEPISAVQLAEVAGMHERTLRKYCTNESLPSPQWIIGWARLLVAAYYLDEPGRSIERIADLLGFPSPTAFRNQLRRYSGLTATALREVGAVAHVARAIERAVRNAGPPPPEPPPERAPLTLVP